MNEREQGVYDRYWPGIRMYMEDQTAAWIMGKGDVDAEWDHYLEEIEELGMHAVLDVLNNARWRSLYSQ